MRRIFVTLAAAAFAAAVIAAGPTACAGARVESSPAPDFSLTDLDGQARTLSAYKGKVLILNFWATWCPPCRVEIPDFVDAYKELKGQGLEILGVSVDDLSANAVRDWTRAKGVNYPVAMATEKIVRDYQPVDFIPTTIIIDRQGQIRYRQSSMMDKDALVRLFKEYSK